MPYAFEGKTLIPAIPGLDRRVKLTSEQRAEIQSLSSTLSVHALARRFSVSWRTVQFILFPDRLEANKVKREERGGSRKYYDSDYHREAIKSHRHHKQKLSALGLLIKKDGE